MSHIVTDLISKPFIDKRFVNYNFNNSIFLKSDDSLHYIMQTKSQQNRDELSLS